MVITLPFEEAAVPTLTGGDCVCTEVDGGELDQDGEGWLGEVIVVGAAGEDGG